MEKITNISNLKELGNGKFRRMLPYCFCDTHKVNNNGENTKE